MLPRAGLNRLAGINAGDVAISGILLLLGYWNLWIEWEAFSPNTPANVTVDTLTVTVACAALLFRRQAPLAVMLIVTAAFTAPDLLVPTGPVFFGEWVPSIVAAYTVAAQVGGWWNLAPLGAAGFAYLVFAARYAPTFYSSPPDAAVFLLPTLGAIAVGQAMRRARQRTADLEHAGEESAARAVLEERARIARELHDVIGRNVTVMVVQAEAAEQVLQTKPDEAHRALEHVQRAGREALAEMQLLLGVLRDPGTAAARTPVPSLGRLDAVIEPFRDSGLVVETAVTGSTDHVPTAIDVSACRVIQESLTNALKHAPGTTVRVHVDIGERSMRVDVRNGLADQGGAPRSPGHGLLGLRERVALHGGSFSAGRQDGEFALVAELPLPSTSGM